MDDLSKVIVFELKEQKYGIDIKEVHYIERLDNITGVPRTSAFIKGLINLRGQVVPVIDLQERLHIGEAAYTDETRVLIVKLQDVQLGLIVDRATDVIDIESKIIEPTPQIIGEVSSAFLKGVAKLESGLLVLLDLESILDLEELNEVQEVIKV